jgi:hypothetical protein
MGRFPGIHSAGVPEGPKGSGLSRQTAPRITAAFRGGLIAGLLATLNCIFGLKQGWLSLRGIIIPVDRVSLSSGNELARLLSDNDPDVGSVRRRDRQRQRSHCRELTAMDPIVNNTPLVQ